MATRRVTPHHRRSITTVAALLCAALAVTSVPGRAGAARATGADVRTDVRTADARASGPATGPQRAVTLTIDGPAQIVLGQLARVHAAGGERGTTYRWDADNKAGFETITGTSPSLDLKPRQGGPLQVRLEATSAAGVVQTVSRRVQVLRPDVVSLRLVPADPRPGQLVKLVMAGRSDAGGFRAYAWDVEGVKATRTRLGVAALGRHGRGARQAARAVGASTVGGFVDTAQAGLDITATNSITVRMPKGKKADGRTIGITAYAFGESGQVAKLHRTVTIDTPLRGFGTKPGSTVNCEDVPAGAPSWPCAQVLAATAYPVVGYPAVFYDVTPAVQVCYPTTTKKPGVLKTRRTEVLDLGYPAVGQFLGNVAVNPISVPGGRTASPAARTATVNRKGTQKCEKREAIPVKWNFGDGVTVKAPGDGKENLPVGHSYAKPGTYKVTLTTKVPYIATSDKKKDGGTPNAPAYNGVSYFTATTSTTVVVTTPFCGALKVRGIPVRSVAISDGAAGCFSVRPTTDKNPHLIYQPTDGYAADLGGLQVYRSIFGSSDAPVVDPTFGTLTGYKDMGGWVRVATTSPTELKRLQVFEGPVLAVPDLAYDARVGREVAALPAHEFATGPGKQPPFLTHLRVVTGQALLSPAAPTVGVATLKLPAPLGGYADALLDGSEPASSTSGRTRRSGEAGKDGPYDVNADLAGVDLGGLGLQSGTLRHRAAGGWEAGVVLDLPGLGTVNAPYEPLGGVGNTCTDTFGPSGLDLDDKGGFNFGGAQLDPAPGMEPVLGPVSLGCVALKAQTAQGSEPFAITGLAQAHVPPNGPITVDGCAAFSLVGTGQTSNLCGRPPLVAPGDLARLVATAEVSLYDGALKLGSGYADLTAGPGGASVVVGGYMKKSVGPFSVKGDVEGGASTNPSQFYLVGGVELCAWLCADVKAGVSTEGFGACASLGGFFYYWDERHTKFFAFSCNLKSYLVNRLAIARRNGLPVFRPGSDAPRAGATQLVVPVPAGQSQVALAVHRADTGTASPDVTLVSPSGKVYVTPAEGTTVDDNPNPDGVQVQRFGGEEVGEGITTFTVPTPEAGDWTVRSGGQTELTVELATPVPEPVVTGNVTLTGNQARLGYDAALAPGDTVRVIESGPQGTRSLGALTAGGSTLTIPTGPRGARTVTAIVERDGIPLRTFTLDGYQAPGLPALAKPAGVTTSASSGGVVVRWVAVPGATSYDVTGTLTDGRAFRRTVTGTSLALPGSSRFTGGQVRVVAKAGVGRDSTPGVRSLAPVTQVRVPL
ncbi:PKD domain-containing protein [Nocardioides sp.]|uniref:PKD domain-containing protein n=1 Tax=Nocardioides sp. TaxID=35761 RepID=UPI0027292B14|nr:PKD domain-containing protein [Nocardioides sp.]MDO9454567.1 PKD domain-containing protein [Nocardioides sp.]